MPNTSTNRPSSTIPMYALLENKLPYRNSSLVHHLFSKERNNPEEQIRQFEKLSFEVTQGTHFKLRFGVNPIRLSEDDSTRGFLTLLKNIPMLCFTDVPAKDSLIHAKEYGCFGLVFSPQFIFDHLPKPVQYVWPIGTTGDHNVIEHHNKVFHELNLYFSALHAHNRITPEDFANLQKFIVRLLSYYQPMMEIEGDDRISRGYLYMAENEWRIVHHDQSEELLNESNPDRLKALVKEFYARTITSSTGHHPYLLLKPYHVQTIFVQDKQYITQVEDIILKKNIQCPPKVITFEEYRAT